MFHPRAANWFDVMVPQNGLSTVLGALAQVRAVELEATNETSYTPADLSALRDGLDAYAQLARRYRAHWPQPDRSIPLSTGAPQQILSASLAQVRQWASVAAPHIGTLQCAVRQIANLKHLHALAGVAGAAFPAHLLSPRPSALFDVSVHLLQHGRMPDQIPGGLAVQTYKTFAGIYVLAIGAHADIENLNAELANLKARQIDMSAIRDAISSNAKHGDQAHLQTDMQNTIASYIEAQEQRRDQEQRLLTKLSERHQLASVQAHAEHLRWLMDHVGETVSTTYFARITGWSAVQENDLDAALRTTGFEYVLSMGPPPSGVSAPLLFDNPKWARPFEAFVRLLGMPARAEADPSPLVAVIAPLLFGFMFGDVGQGFVLLVAGLVLRRKWPDAAILVPGGAMAMVFGVMFGTIFAREDVIGALWLHPLLDPIPVLGVALAAGVAILLTGLALNGASAHWRNQGRKWWSAEAGLALAYVGVLFSFAQPGWGQVVVGIGAAWFLFGSAYGVATVGQATSLGVIAAGFGKALGELVEGLFQILINTLSFVRVGAFAIAHAGLSSALMVLADIAGPGIGFWLVMIVGNVFILALEGLVVGIQTTRLLLFEFFIRFLRAEGRPLRVLPTPVDWSIELEGKPS